VDVSFDTSWRAGARRLPPEDPELGPEGWTRIGKDGGPFFSSKLIGDRAGKTGGGRGDFDLAPGPVAFKVLDEKVSGTGKS